MEEDDRNHRMSPPPVEVPEKLTGGDDKLQIFHVIVRLLHRRAIIEHEQSTGKNKNNKQPGRKTSQAPRIGELDRSFANFGWMEVEEEIVEDRFRACAIRKRQSMAKDRSPHLRLCQPFKNVLHGRSPDVSLMTRQISATFQTFNVTSSRTRTDLSTMSCPWSSSDIAKRGRGLGAGPAITFPSLSNLLP